MAYGDESDTLDYSAPDQFGPDFWTQHAPQPGPSTTPPASDDAAILAQIKQWSTMPGANPSLARDPQYWLRRIKETGGLRPDNTDYWKGLAMRPEGAPEGGGGAPNPNAPLPVTPYGGIGSTPSPYVNPTWEGGPAPTAPTLTKFTRPTQADLEASPGYQARILLADQGLERSAAARGSVLSGGFQQEMANYNQDYASNEYNNLFGQGLALNQNNNNVAQTQFGDAFQTYQANYGQFTDAAARGLNAYNTNVNTQRNAGNDYWTHLNDLYKTGADLAGNSYRPSNVP